MFARRAAFIASLSAHVVACLPSVAHACSCGGFAEAPNQRPQRLHDEIRASAAVFLGELTGVDQFNASFRVDKVWKGSLDGAVVLGTGTEIRPGNLRLLQGCTLNFRDAVGQRYIVFADADGFGRLTANRCGSTLPESAATETIAIVERVAPSRYPMPQAETRRAQRLLPAGERRSACRPKE